MITLTKTQGKLGYKYTCPLCEYKNVKVLEPSAGKLVLDDTWCDSCGTQYSFGPHPVDEGTKILLKAKGHEV